MLQGTGEPANDSRVTDRASYGPIRAGAESVAVEAELYDARGDQAGAVAAGVAGDIELCGESVEAALGGALAYVQGLGKLCARRRAAGEGSLTTIGGDERGSRRALFFVQRHRGLGRGDGAASPAGNRVGDFESVATDDQRVAVAQPPWPVERLAVQCRAVAAVEVGCHQRPTPVLDLEVVPGDRLVVDRHVGLGVPADDSTPGRKLHRPRLPALARQPDPRIHRSRA